VTLCCIEPHSEGSVLVVYAQPGSRRRGLRGLAHDCLRVAVTERAKRDKANQAVLDLLSDSLDLRGSQLTMLSGHRSRRKRILMRGASEVDLARRVNAALGNDA